MTNTTSPARSAGYSASFLGPQTFTARPSAPGEGGNYVVVGSQVGVVMAVATLNPDFADESARRYQSEWDTMTVGERHLRLHNRQGCTWCDAQVELDSAAYQECPSQ